MSIARKPVIYGYARVSTEKQVMEGNSIEDQEIRLQAHVKSLPELSNCQWGGIFVDPGTSGMVAFIERKAGKELNERLRRGDFVLMTSIDRGFRNFRDCIETADRWLEQGIHIHILDMGIATNTPHGQFVYRIFAALADMMRKLMLETVARGTRRKREKYGAVGNADIKLGFKNFGSVEKPKVGPNMDERRFAALITHLTEDCGLTFQETANLLHHYGILVTPRGGWVSIMTIWRYRNAYINGGFTEPCLQLPPPSNWKPWKRRNLLMNGKPTIGLTQHYTPKLPDDSSLAIRVTDSTRPLRAIRLLSTPAADFSSPVLPDPQPHAKPCEPVSSPVLPQDSVGFPQGEPAAAPI